MFHYSNILRTYKEQTNKSEEKSTKDSSSKKETKK